MLATPPMGWNSWNTFGRAINEQLIKDVADTLATSGLRDLGYQYLNVDDHWHGGRDEHGVLYPNAEKFPNGMKALSDYVHARGLKFGIYSDAAELTCGGEVGSLGYEEQDAQTFAAWGVDYLKYDYCHAPQDRETAIQRYTRMGNALKATGREIVFSVCEWGGRQPWLWATQAGGHLWRTTGDIWDGWSDGSLPFQMGIERIGFELQRGLEDYAGPGRWNDPDMLVVGMQGKGHIPLPTPPAEAGMPPMPPPGVLSAPGCTDDEYRTHFALWCLLAAPLLIGCDIRHMDDVTRETLMNAELIAVNQDALGRQGYRAQVNGKGEVWLKPLQGGALALGLFNRADIPRRVTAHIAELNFDNPFRRRMGREELNLAERYHVRDLWKHANAEDVAQAGEISAELPVHGCAVFKLTPAT